MIFQLHLARPRLAGDRKIRTRGRGQGRKSRAFLGRTVAKLLRIPYVLGTADSDAVAL